VTVGELIATLQTLPPDAPVDWSVAQLAEGIPVITGAEASLAALRYEAVASFDAKGGAQITGSRTTGDWLRRATGMSHAGAIVNTARALRDELPATAAALAQGRISEQKLVAIRRAHRMLGEDFIHAESEIVKAAGRLNEKDLRAVIDELIQQYRPEDYDDDTDRARTKRKFHLSQSLDGWWHAKGLLDPETGHRLNAALDVYAQTSGPDDLRKPSTRNADALAEIADKSLANIDRPSGRGQVLIRLSVEQLHTRLGVSWPDGTLMTRAQVDAFTCTAAVNMVLGANRPDGWHPVNLGHTERYATKAQRLALQARDGDTCIHPDCTVPADRCVAHHIVHWRDGGPSDIDNYALPCGRHHNDLHTGKLIIVIRPDGSYTTAPAHAN
jgi:hypothetical protein